MADMNLIDPQYATDQLALQRRMSLAEALRKQSMEGMGDTQMIGGVAIPKSPMEGIAKMFQGYTSGQMDKENDAKRLQMSADADAAKKKDIQGLIDALQGKAAVPQNAPSDGMGPTLPAQPAQPGSQLAAALYGLQSHNPMIQGVGGKMLEQSMKGSEGVNINGQLVDKFTGKPMGQSIPKQEDSFTLGDTRYGSNGKPLAVYNDPNKPFSSNGASNTAYQQYEISKSRAGASKNVVNVAGAENEYNKGIGKGLAEQNLSTVDIAKQAPEVIRNAQMIRDALKAGAITGTGADARLAVEKALATTGLIGEGRAANTQALMAGLGKVTLSGIKTSGLGAGNGFTDKDRAFLEGAISGTISSTPENIKRVADLSERVARANHSKGQAILQRWQNDPSLGAVAKDSQLDSLPSGNPHAAKTDAQIRAELGL